MTRWQPGTEGYDGSIAGKRRVKSALDVRREWEGHELWEVAEIQVHALRGKTLRAAVSDAVKTFRGQAGLVLLDQVVPIGTMDEVAPEPCPVRLNGSVDSLPGNQAAEGPGATTCRSLLLAGSSAAGPTRTSGSPLLRPHSGIRRARE